jgi:hypothetical protein
MQSTSIGVYSLPSTFQSTAIYSVSYCTGHMSHSINWKRIFTGECIPDNVFPRIARKPSYIGNREMSDELRNG